MAATLQDVTPVHAPAVEGAGLLDEAETAEALRSALGGQISEAQLQAAVAALKAAEVAKWEQLPPEINADMGYHFRFLSCTETCWLGRQVLVEGATFRIFRMREQETA